MLIVAGVNLQSLAFSDSPVADATYAVSCEKKAWKNFRLARIWPWPLWFQCRWTGSWSINWFIMYLGKMKMKRWIIIYEFHVFEPQKILSSLWVTTSWNTLTEGNKCCCCCYCSYQRPFHLPIRTWVNNASCGNQTVWCEVHHAFEHKY